MTKKQEEMLTFCSEYIATHGKSPSYREIAAHFDISLRMVQERLTALENKGYVQITHCARRGIKIIED